MVPRSYRRKKYFVAPKLQMKYVGLILLLMFSTAALCSYVVYYTAMINIGEKLANVYPQGRLLSIVRLVNIRILLSLILVSPLVAIIGIFLSHRIAGPIYRMENFLNNVATGDLTNRLTLRKKDELINLANGINNVVDSLKYAVTKEKGHLDKISKDLEILKRSIREIPVNQTAANEAVTDADVQVKCLNDDLKIYKLEPILSAREPEAATKQ